MIGVEYSIYSSVACSATNERASRGCHWRVGVYRLASLHSWGTTGRRKDNQFEIRDYPCDITLPSFSFSLLYCNTALPHIFNTLLSDSPWSHQTASMARTSNPSKVGCVVLFGYPSLFGRVDLSKFRKTRLDTISERIGDK